MAEKNKIRSPLQSLMSAIPTKIEMRKMKKQLANLQHIINDDILSIVETDTTYKGNNYQSYAVQVAEVSSKYMAEADWGVLQTGNIIDVRAAFIMGQGITVKKKEEDAEKEVEFINNFLEYNDLNKEVAQEFAKEAEIEGKFLGQLFWDKKAVMVSVRFRSWTEYGYTIKTDANDYMKYEKVKWKAGSKEGSLEAKDFVYKRFGGRIHKPNLSPPKVAKCLTQIENLDKDLRDWRRINNLYAAPTPHFECETAEQAKKMNDVIARMNWKIGKLIAHTGKFSYAQPSIQGLDGLEKAIITNAKIISGTTGCPVHFLGLPDLMSNRATAENLMELVYASTLKERLIWIGAYEEMIEKAMAIFNITSKKTPLVFSKISIDIPFITQAQWERLEKVYLPSYLSGAISLDYYLSQIPGLDVEEEMSRQEEKDTDLFKDIKDKTADKKEKDDKQGEEGAIS